MPTRACSRNCPDGQPIADDPQSDDQALDPGPGGSAQGEPFYGLTPALKLREFPRLCRGGSQSLTTPGVTWVTPVTVTSIVIPDPNGT